MSLKAMSRRKLAQLMGISTTTFRRKLQQHQITIPKGVIPPDNSKKILSTLGYKELFQQSISQKNH